MRSIDPSLLSKLKKQNQTIHENANPKMSVVIARARSSIMDASYFTVENIRTKVGISDISVATRRRKPYGAPDGLFDIHLDGGIAKTTFRAYPDKLKLKWQPQFVLESSKAVAICFNGHWERYRDYWQLTTEEYPHIFWADNSGKLFTRHWDDELTKYELATNVVKVKAVRGWKNINFEDRDHGLIAGYIKTDGKLYYRNYCTQITGETSWESERQITEFTGTAVNLNMFLTNDYRTAFIVEDSLGKIHWIITERNWAGMALAPHTVSVSAVEIGVEIIDIKYPKGYMSENISVSAVEIGCEVLFARTDNSLISVNNIAMTRLNEDLEEYEDWGFKIRFRLNYETMVIPVVTLTDATTLSVLPIESVTEIEQGYEYEILMDDSLLEFGINNVQGDITIKIIGARNEAGDDYDIIEEDFTPTNLEAGNIPLPEIEVIFNE